MAIKAKPTPEQQRASRIAQLDSEKAYFEQITLTQQAEREQSQAERQEFTQRVEARRKAEAAAASRGEQLQHEPIPHIRDVWAATRAAELQAEAEKEAARIAALTPRDVWFSTLSFTDQQKVSVWERVNKGQKYPVPGLE
jgi:hypothetical protein